MAAPVHEEGEVVGGLVVGSFDPDRRFSQEEQDVLLAFAEHVSLALTDARTVEAMREAQRHKELFLAMVSHDLKTPLTVVMAALYTFKKHPDMPDDMRERILTSALDRGTELERLINRLLQGSRAELAPEREEIPLSEVLADALRGFEQARSLSLGDVPDVLVDVDPVAIRELLGILLENAVSHSPPASLVQVEPHVDTERATIAITNEGSLPEDIDPSALFLPFHRGEGARSLGVGLGLYIAARLAESLEGQLEASSREGRVCFTLSLPYRASRVEEPASN